jgi:hypothetical protein
MSDDPKLDKPDDGWVMPEPVYRSTPGRSPGEIHQAESTGDDTTQPGFIDQDNIDTLAPNLVDPDEVPTEKPIKVKAAEPLQKKKRGCARSFLTVVSLIVLAVIGVVILLIYLLFSHKPDGPF